MLSDVIQSLERSFQKLSTNRFLFVGFLVGVVLLADYLTGFSFYYNISNQIETLQALKDLNESGIGEQQRVRELYESVLAHLEERQRPLFPTTVPLLDSLPPWLGKGISGSYVFIFSVPILALLADKTTGFLSVLGGGLIAIMAFFVVGFATPTLGSLGIHFFVFSGLQIVTFIIITKRGQNMGM